jgi:hypothetical protein
MSGMSMLRRDLSSSVGSAGWDGGWDNRYLVAICTVGQGRQTTKVGILLCLIDSCGPLSFRHYQRARSRQLVDCVWPRSIG